MVRLGLPAAPKGQRVCGECGSPFIPKRHDQAFCSPQCRFADHNRAMQRGREAYRALYHWVLGNGRGQRGSLIGTVSGLARKWVAEDREAGRLPPPLPEDLVLRRQNARTGYVKVTGKGYVKDPAKAEAVLREIG